MNTNLEYVRAIGRLVEQLGTAEGAALVAESWMRDGFRKPISKYSHRSRLRNALAITMGVVTGAAMATLPDGTVALTDEHKQKIVDDIRHYDLIRERYYVDG